MIHRIPSWRGMVPSHHLRMRMMYRRSFAELLRNPLTSTMAAALSATTTTPFPISTTKIPPVFPKEASAERRFFYCSRRIYYECSIFTASYWKSKGLSLFAQAPGWKGMIYQRQKQRRILCGERCNLPRRYLRNLLRLESLRRFNWIYWGKAVR